MAATVFSRPNQARRNKRHIADQHPSNATLVPDEPDDDFRPLSASVSRDPHSPHPGNYPIYDDLLPSNVSELGAPSARGYHTTSQFREKPLHAPPPSKPQKRSTLGLKGVGKILRRTFSRKHSSAPAPSRKRVPSPVPSAPSSRPSFYNPNHRNHHIQASEVMDVNIPYEHHEHPQSPLDADPQSHSPLTPLTPYDDYTTPLQQHSSPSSALGRRATTPHPRRRPSSRSIRSFASSERVSLSQQHPVHPHAPRVHPARPIHSDRPLPPTRAGTRLVVPLPPVATPHPSEPQRKRIFTGPWYNRRGDMWIGVGPGPGEFRVVNTPERAFHHNFQSYPSEHGHFMNAEGDTMDAVTLRMVHHRAPS